MNLWLALYLIVAAFHLGWFLTKAAEEDDRKLYLWGSAAALAWWATWGAWVAQAALILWRNHRRRCKASPAPFVCPRDGASPITARTP